jgi:PAS domain S-box-containing protein
MFARLMVLQWFVGIAAALWISPRTWEGETSHTHIHVWAAIFLGGMISGFPVLMATIRPGTVLTRHVIATGQMLSCGLLIHLMGGRIESHFQYFGALAFLAFYFDWRVLLTATVIAGADHFIRGYWWPESIFGVSYASLWLPVEHVGWILFEDIILVLSIRQNLRGMLGLAERQSQLEIINETIERKVDERTSELRKEIVEREQAEKQMERLREEQTIVLNSLEDGVHWIDVNGLIKFENPAAAKMLGYTITDLIGKPAHVTMHHSHADGSPYPVAECPIYASLRDEKIRREKDEVFWRHDGSSFPVEYICTPVTNENGHAAGVVVEFTDVTERKSFAIIGQSELLLEELPPDGPLGKSAHEIHLAADRAAALTRQLLAYGRKQILQPAILNLNQVLPSMLGTLQHLMGREVELRFIPGVGLKTVKIDPGQIEQVIVNIALNAADAMPNGGKFVVETSNVMLDHDFVRPYPGLKPGSYVMLALSDTGVGMTNEVKARVFEPFFSTKGAGQGTGLGLATCYGILKQSDGHIDVYSERSRGTTFKIYLPQVEQVTETAIRRKTSLDLPRGTETILLAEDDPSLLEMSATLLRRLGYNVLTAVDGVDALHLKHQRDIGHIDLLFTDVVMPNMSGKELSDRFRAIHPEIKILFTSAFTENAIVDQGILNKGVMLLQKPFTPSALAQKVREILDLPYSSNL